MRVEGWRILLDLLACYRLVVLVVADDLTAPVRRAFGDAESYWGGAIRCPWCVSVWTAFGVVAWETWAPEPWSYLALGLALSAGASILAGLMGNEADG